MGWIRCGLVTPLTWVIFFPLFAAWKIRCEEVARGMTAGWPEKLLRVMPSKAIFQAVFFLVIHALPLLPILFHWRVWTLPVASGGEEGRRPAADTSAVFFPLALENLIETRVAEDQTHYTGGGGRWYGAKTRLILSVLSGVSRRSCPLLNLLVWEQAGTLGTDVTGVTDGVSDGSASPERSSPPRAGRSGTSEVA